jgi:aryl-alcohol dehydrogenase-like predicted oxidoreductase
MDGDVRRLRLATPGGSAESIATVQAALDAGINLLDTGDFYGAGHNAMLVGQALRGRRRD